MSAEVKVFERREKMSEEVRVFELKAYDVFAENEAGTKGARTTVYARAEDEAKILGMNQPRMVDKFKYSIPSKIRAERVG